MGPNNLGTEIRRGIREMVRHILLQPEHRVEMVRLEGQLLQRGWL